MKVYLYKGGLSVVEKSGVGSAIHHQEKMLRMAGVSVTQSWAEADVVHINTVFPDSFLAACRARREKKKVIYYGQSTMEDGVQVYKASDVKEFRQKLENIFTGEGARMAAPERQLAEKHSLIRTGKRIMDIYRKETSGEIY